MVVRCIFCLCSLCLSLSLCFFLSFKVSSSVSLSASAIMAMLASQSTCRTTSPQCSTEAETEFKSRKRTLDELSRPRCHHRNRSRAQLRRRTSRRRGRRAHSWGSATGTWERESTQDIKNDAHPDSRSCKPRHRSSNENPHRVRKMTTHRKGFVQCCKKPRTSQQCQRPACHVHLRGACGRDVGDVEEGIESGRTLSPESEILLPLLVEMPKSRANRIFSSEQDTGIGAVSSALIRGFPVKTAASSAASVSSRPSSSSSSCPASAVCSSSSPPSTCEFAILARIFYECNDIHSNLQELTVSAGRPVTGSIWHSARARCYTRGTEPSIPAPCPRPERPLRRCRQGSTTCSSQKATAALL